MTKEQLDEALAEVTTPAPVIVAGPWHPINRWDGFNNPYEGFYRGVRVQIVDGLDDECFLSQD